ncbi:MAG: Crp/Fnr family transcriptional regulator [Aestuariivirga sp.]|uniref:Crp/Fnr family transcriptional regulator n=1 Tax=Aestuariivirga sp. TaxID=2650926 RepID=UPI0025B8BAC7|nr:Crp/Fnr family transcriptional regulator [Aestuariivirga sp.]MCA3561717.1 Crp/Fnr family transcriptional regulator [Aestuariivirga sp.]
MSVRADVETLRSIPIFSECDAVHLQLLAFSAPRQNFSAGEFLIRQGNKGAAAFLILSGEARLSSTDAGPLGSFGEGSLLGEIAMIGDRPYSVTATAVNSMSTARIDRELFMRLAREFPEFGTAVFGVLSRRLDLVMGDLEATRRQFEKARSFKSV